MFFLCLFVFCGEDRFWGFVFLIVAKTQCISYFFGEDSFAKMTPRPAARRHIFSRRRRRFLFNLPVQNPLILSEQRASSTRIEEYGIQLDRAACHERP
jgi:hypothetical protein